MSSGLDRVVAAETRLSMVDGEKGELVIAGYPLGELAPNATFEQTIHLLWTGELPDEKALQKLRSDLVARRALPRRTLELLRDAAREHVDVMDALRMGASTMVAQDDAEASPRLVAVFPTIVASYWRLQSGGDPIAPRADLGHAANYLYMLTGEVPNEERVRALETYLNTVVDHGLNASTFTARVIASTGSDFVSAVVGGCDDTR